MHVYIYARIDLYSFCFLYNYNNKNIHEYQKITFLKKNEID